MSDTTGFTLGIGMDLAGVELQELWWRYAALGGAVGPEALALCIVETDCCDRRQHDLIAQALNEAFLDRGYDTFPVAYADGVAPVPVVGPQVPTSMARSLDARRHATLARLRSAAAARHSAQLHATAAQLMQASGQLQFARLAATRAQAARQRAARTVAA